jgi:UrcA family protein
MNVQKFSAGKFSAGALRLALLAGGLVAASGSALADEPKEVVIEAARPTQFMRGTPSEVLSIKRQVSYADLDLATQKGDRELEKRINEAAIAVCKRIDQLQPPEQIADTSCVKKTLKGAMAQAQAAISAASAAAANK